MNPEKKSLVWKYFWEQKAVELSKGFIIIAAIILIPLALGALFGDSSALICGDDAEVIQECGIIYQWFAGLVVSFLAAMSGLFLFLIGFMIWEWIKENWERATERATAELKRSKKNGK